MAAKKAKEKMQDYHDALQQVECHVKWLTRKSMPDMIKDMSDYEQAKYKTVLAYAVATTQLCYLRTKGENLENHPNMKHLERLKAFFMRIDRYVDQQQVVKKEVVDDQ